MAGATFAKKINLSNTTGAESVNAEIAASGKNVLSLGERDFKQQIHLL
jgi:hypothetical protein